MGPRDPTEAEACGLVTLKIETTTKLETEAPFFQWNVLYDLWLYVDNLDNLFKEYFHKTMEYSWLWFKNLAQESIAGQSI